MYVKKMNDCVEFVAGDASRLRELVHAQKGDFAFRYSLAHAIIGSEQKTKPHRLKTSEVYYIIEGIGRMCIDGESEPVGPGDTVYIPPNASQHIENTGLAELKFLCIVDPAWRPEDEDVR